MKITGSRGVDFYYEWGMMQVEVVRMAKKLSKTQVKVIDWITANPGVQFKVDGVYGRGFKKTVQVLIKKGFVTIDSKGRLELT